MSYSSAVFHQIAKLPRRAISMIRAVLFSWWFVVDVIVEVLTVDESEISGTDEIISIVNNQYWIETVRLASHIALLLVIIGIATVLSFPWSEPIQILSILLGLFYTFWASESITKDKETLSKTFENVDETDSEYVFFFSLITASLYIHWYVLSRGRNPAKEGKMKRTTANNFDSTEVVVQPSGRKENSPPVEKSTQSHSKEEQNTKSTFFEQPPNRDFDDIAGMEHLKKELREKVIQPLNGGGAYSELDVGVENGILLHGPPGTGKTHAATCLAGELGINFALINTNEVTSEYLGVGVKAVKHLFAEARVNQPVLIFFDELDAIAGDRSDRSQHHDRKQIVSQLLQELSAIDNEEIIVIGATNNLSAIDKAILRTGRFDSKIEVNKPDINTKAKIFTQHLPATPPSVDYSEFKRATQNLTASDIVTAAESTARSAARRANRTGQSVTISSRDVFDGIEDVCSNQRQLGNYVTQPPAKDFSDAAGMKSLKNRLYEIIIDPLENQHEYESFGITPETGILLYGPPGTGKTHIAQCLAGELGINYLECNASELTSKFVGESAKNVGQLFNQATQHSPSLIFLDEFDALSTDRSAGPQTKSQRQLVNQLLQELSALQDSNETVIVIAATNRPADIDAAMLRTGRFSEKIKVPAPDSETRVRMLQAHLKAPTAEFDVERIQHLTDGFVASDMAHVATEAARYAVRRPKKSAKKKVTQQDIEAAVKSINKSTKVTP